MSSMKPKNRVNLISWHLHHQKLDSEKGPGDKAKKRVVANNEGAAFLMLQLNIYLSYIKAKAITVCAQSYLLANSSLAWKC